MLKKLANGEIKPRIIPGSTMHYNTPKSEDVCDSYGKDPPCGEGKNYVNTVLEGYENEDYLEVSNLSVNSFEYVFKMLKKKLIGPTLMPKKCYLLFKQIFPLVFKNIFLLIN